MMDRQPLQGLGIGAGDEVIVPSFAPESAAAAVVMVGARPVFADIDPRTYCLDPAFVEAALTPRTSAVIAVHLFGHPAPMRELGTVAARQGIALVEELVEEEEPAGGMGEIARRRANAWFLDSVLTGVIVPYVEPGAHHVYHHYTVRIPGNGRPDRDAFARALAARGVRATVSVPTPVHRLAAHRSRAQLPETELAAAQALSLPVHSGLTQRELTHIADACNALGGLL
ncbi:DegT/DnrJ/EryC1/StrS family aminotransferase [Streptomyces sp. H10-C2]|uniref:DegT/DnrJ/EryC1/StrS family aminotransferase n=1 Tax=unclassified Streptomyces TaxID=2593676 RepID=UPI0024BB62B6|nr:MULTISPECIES: DegT/DnrJ/EryC1/StrS family aminotransferase [unclassified Streptomyces]MDJ0341640.1 DegT/DnrJ/EryC1/StrS family aminotransferase [Streptomyces sp. PH10-H1]MDJ0371258.1 DegT/DnrJ/EryC1/StrS family aminotransferase [Streptomyces sp. H10-C2]